jgi:hypothetical protein
MLRLTATPRKLDAGAINLRPGCGNRGTAAWRVDARRKPLVPASLGGATKERRLMSFRATRPVPLMSPSFDAPTATTKFR